jgi:hypothetical protein
VDRELGWKVLGAASGFAAGFVTRKLLKVAWRSAKGTEPPTNPASPRTTWSEAITWAAASGVAMAVMRLIAQRGAAEAWKKKTGAYPRALETVSP